MPRFRITIEYDGGDFSGWQRQANSSSIQQALEDAVEAFSGETPDVIGAGRTDAGVHALAQVAHFDLEIEPVQRNDCDEGSKLSPQTRSIVIRHAIETVPDFHARFSATERSYLYRILNRPAPAALDRGRVCTSRRSWMQPPCMKRRRLSSANTTSPPSGQSIVRLSHRKKPWMP